MSIDTTTRRPRLRTRIYNALFEENGDFTPRGTLLFMATFCVICYFVAGWVNTWS